MMGFFQKKLRKNAKRDDTAVDKTKSEAQSLTDQLTLVEPLLAETIVNESDSQLEFKNEIKELFKV
jgi:hypothetical protein